VSEPRYSVRFRPAAEKQLDRLDKPIRARIMRTVAALADDPRPPGVIRLTGVSDLWRARAGDYRVVYQIRDAELIVRVVRVAHRSVAYRDI
jgi:mRNA interferase RelE/StbE